MVCLVVDLPSRNGGPWKQWLVRLKTHVVLQPVNLSVQQEGSISHFTTQDTKTMCTQRWTFSNINNLAAF